ncbi:MAG: thiamine pyrophosphate-dependent dehydrogenase E1 component subunit alpha [Planctomycetes bacterium]|nr:thiamine pyrophosphate-dependent dehydrogenase E1 component subunit alpha [Planctomycetota bacterium]
MSNDPQQILDPKGNKVGKAPRVSHDVLLRMFRAIVQTRHFDDRCMKLQRTGRIGFSIPNLGVEAVSVGAAAALDATKDWVAPSYRDFGMLFFHGVSPESMMDTQFGNADDHSVGRQMPVHFTFREPVRMLSISSPIGTHIPQAVGMALAEKARGTDSIALSSFGDGGTSSSGFHSGLNFAGVMTAPVVFLCQNNQWAISCPYDQQTGSETIAIKGEAYGIPAVRVDGNDVLAVYKAVAAAVKRARAGEGPTLVEAVTMRMGGHSTSDDPSKYVPEEMMEKWREKDPLVRFRAWLESEGILKSGDAERIEEECASEMAAAAKAAEAKGRPALDTVFTDVYEDIPDHLRTQRDWCVGHYSSRGEAVNEEGEFPL